MCLRLILILLSVLPASAYDLVDFAAFSREWQGYRSPTRCLQYDYDHSGIVDLYDLDIFLDGWIMSYPNQLVINGTGLSPDIDGVIVTLSDETPSWTGNIGSTAAIALGLAGESYVLTYTPQPNINTSTWVGVDYTGEFTADSNATGTATVSEYETFGAPTITAEADNDSITVTVDGTSGALHTVLYKLVSATTWTTGGTVSDDGDVVISDLSAGNYYVIAYSSNDGGNSTPSNLLYVSVSSGGDYIEEAVYSLITSDAAIVNAVSSRVYPQTIPQAVVLPALRYNLISSGREHNTVLAEDMVEARFQIDVISETYKQARQVAEVVRLALDKYSGTIGNVTIQCIHLINEMDYYSDAAGNDQLRRFGKTQEYTVWYNQALS